MGYAFDRVMIYAKGGYAGGKVGFKARDNDALVTYEQNEWHNGYALGAGVDYALTDKLSLGVDYTHIDLDRRQAPATTCLTTARWAAIPRLIERGQGGRGHGAAEL